MSAKTKNNPYFPFYPNDHLNDLNLMGCHAAAKGVWWDMVSLMAQGSPFGHLRIEPGTKKNIFMPAGADPHLNAGGYPIGHPIGHPTGKPIGKPRKKGEATLTLSFEGTLSQKQFALSDNGSLEPDLARIIRQKPDLVEWALAELEHRGVFSRTDQGIIYCRRMVRMAQKQAEQAEHGKKAWENRQRSGGSQPRKQMSKQGGKPAGEPTGEPIGYPTGQPIGHPRPNTNTNTKSRNITPTPQPPAPRGRGLSDEEIEKAVQQRKKVKR